MASDDDLWRARGLLAAPRRVTVLTGAGISTDSGIPDFRGPNGVWTRNPAAERASTLSHYLGDAEVRRQAWQTRIHSPAWDARPNAGHDALVKLERDGRLVALVTQNIDELHQQAGNNGEKVVEIHGSMRRVVCWECGAQGPMQPILERVRGGEEDPACAECGGILKSATISFGQNLDPDVLAGAERAARTCDAFLAVGSSLVVYPAAGLVPLAKRSGAALVIVNAEETPFDDIADVVLNGPISELLPQIV